MQKPSPCCRHHLHILPGTRIPVFSHSSSKNVYKRGISTWNFDIEDLKAQAALIPECEGSGCKDPEECQKPLSELDTLQKSMPEGTGSTYCSLKDKDTENHGVMQNKASLHESPDRMTCYRRSQPDRSDNDPKDACSSDQSNMLNGVRLNDKEINEEQLDRVPTHSFHERRASTSSCSSDVVRLSKIDSLKQQDTPNCNGAESHSANGISTEAAPKASKPTAANSDELDKLKPHVQQRRRFKPTSENKDLDKALLPLGLQKSHSMQVISQASPSLPSPKDHTSNLGSSVFQQLHCILQTNILQRDNILSVMKQLSPSEFPANRAAEGVSFPVPTVQSDKSVMQLDAANEREKELIQEISNLQWRVVCLQEELQKLKTKTAQ